MDTIFSSYTASISELKKNPSRLLEDANGEPIAILNHNKTSAYLVPADVYEEMLDRLEDEELVKIVKSRQHEEEDAIEVNIDDL